MNTSIKKLSTSKCLQHAKMLIPKFAFEHEGRWHIQWPLDLEQVIHADTEKALVIALSLRLQHLGRVTNQGDHVKADYPQ